MPADDIAQQFPPETPSPPTDQRPSPSPYELAHLPTDASTSFQISMQPQQARSEPPLQTVLPPPLLSEGNTDLVQSPAISTPNTGCNGATTTSASMVRSPHQTTTEPPRTFAPVVKTCFTALGGILRAINLPGASACDLLIQAVNKYEEMQLNVDALISLRKYCDRIARVIMAVSMNETGPELSEQLKSALGDLGRFLEKVVAPCEDAQKEHFFFKFWSSQENSAMIRKTFDEVGRELVVFVAEITLIGHLALMKKVENTALADNIKWLNPVDAAHNSNHEKNKQRSPCLADTRTELLKAIGRWAVTEKQDQPIYLLTGHAGFGKSTIARTVAKRIDNLGASFFFSRDDPLLRSNSRFFTTIAYQLCVFDEGFAEAIGRALAALQAYNAIKTSPANQLNKLILEPLKSFNDTSRTVVIVIDALDECEDFESLKGESWRRDIWDGLTNLVRTLTFIRVFVTSRPHQHLSTLLPKNALIYEKKLSLNPSDPDIIRYLRVKLTKANSDSQWPGWTINEHEISDLAQMAAGLFIIASTSILYILDPRKMASPSVHIKDLLEGTIDVSDSGTTPHDVVDNMYKTILKLSLTLGDSRVQKQFQTIVGSIIFLRRKFTLAELACLLHEDIRMIRNIIAKLQAIITLTADDQPQFHKSFVDYISNDARSHELCISQSQVQANLAYCCFRALGEGVIGQRTVVRYASRNIEHHCAAADQDRLHECLSDAQADLVPSFWIEVAKYHKLQSCGDHVHNIILEHKGTSDNSQVVDELLNLDSKSEEILSEETLRLILTSKAADDSHTREYSRFILQYMKTLLRDLSNDEIWQQHWILPSAHVWKYSRMRPGLFQTLQRLYGAPKGVEAAEKLVNSFIGQRGDGWDDSIAGMTYRRFVPSDEAWAILRRKLLEQYIV